MDEKGKAKKEIGNWFNGPQGSDMIISKVTNWAFFGKILGSMKHLSEIFQAFRQQGIGTALHSIHAKLGDLWWYTLLLFAAQRISDAINMFVGLWLVPKYVPQQELGAVMPLTQFAAFVGIPLAIVAVPFMKFLGVFAERGEMGKVKALLRDVFIGTAAMAAFTLLLTYLLLPFFFTRMRVEVGSLGILIVGVSILSAVSNIFQNATQGLKLFKVSVWATIISAPLRLVAMLLTMPFRAISGYFVGQGAGPGVMVLGSLWALRGKLGSNVRPQPYLKEHGREIWQYTWPMAIAVVSGIIFPSVDQLVIRHFLSDFDSAGYYVISRFAETAAYLGSSFIIFLFPIVARHQDGSAESRRMLWHSTMGTAIGGMAISLMLLLGGKPLLGLCEAWRPYQGFTCEMFMLAVYNTVNMVCACLITYAYARGHFRFLLFTTPLFIIKAAFLYCISGYTFFTGMLPQPWIDAIAAFNPNRLTFVLQVFLVFHFIYLAIMLWLFRKERGAH